MNGCWRPVHTAAGPSFDAKSSAVAFTSGSARARRLSGRRTTFRAGPIPSSASQRKAMGALTRYSRSLLSSPYIDSVTDSASLKGCVLNVRWKANEFRHDAHAVCLRIVRFVKLVARRTGDDQRREPALFARPRIRRQFDANVDFRLGASVSRLHALKSAQAGCSFLRNRRRLSRCARALHIGSKR